MNLNGLVYLLVVVLIGGVVCYVLETLLPSPIGWVAALIVGLLILLWVVRWFVGNHGNTKL